MTTAEKYENYVMPTYGRFPVVPVRGRGTELWDETGKRYLDFCTGIAVCSIGHAHPRLTAALAQQAQTLVHCSNLYHIQQQADLAELLVETCIELPGKMFFSNSGAEANDGLIKLARRYGHARPNSLGESRFEILTFDKSFHGRTLGAMSATGQEKIHDRFHPLLPGFRHLPYNDLKAVEDAVGERTVAILLEPIQGEGGIISAKTEFLSGIANLCQKHDLLLMVDEVQCGFGRTGHLMGWRAFNDAIKPDAISWAKGMGGGFPIGGFWASDRLVTDTQTPLSSLLGPGSHGSTYGGSPLASAASLAVLSEIIENNLCDNVVHRSDQIRETIHAWSHPAIQEVRGAGLLLGLGLDPTRIETPAGKTPALFLCEKLLEAGLLVPPAGTETIRLLPPLNVSEAEVSEALDILKATLDQIG